MTSDTRVYRNPSISEQQAEIEHRNHITWDVTKANDARQVVYCKDCRVYFNTGEHPNINARKQMAGAF